MPKSIFRKLKDYIQVEEKQGLTTTTSIFGTLRDTDCRFRYTDKNGTNTYIPNGMYDSSMDFLLEYYVVGIFPNYELKDNKIKPYLLVCLRKDIEVE